MKYDTIFGQMKGRLRVDCTVGRKSYHFILPRRFAIKKVTSIHPFINPSYIVTILLARNLIRAYFVS